MAPPLKDQFGPDVVRAIAETLPVGPAGFRAWFRVHEESMRANPVQRELNNVVARQLLPHVERESAGWEALAFYSRAPEAPGRTLDACFADWAAGAPQGHRRFLCALADEFGAGGAVPA